MSRLFSGVRLSFVVGFLTVFVSLLTGTIVGAISGYADGLVDEFLMRGIDILMAFPGLLLAIALTAVFGPGLENIVIALSALGWIDYARIVRTETLHLKETAFVESSQALGTPAYMTVMRHILPNLFSILIVRASYGIGSAVIGEASLSFLGLGATEDISLGSMINDGIEYLQIAPHLAFFPGIAIMLIVLSTNIIGDCLNMKRKYIEEMKLEEKIGQLLMFGFSGTELNKQTRNYFEKNYIGGFILFERNYKNLVQLINLTSDIHEFTKGTIPLIAVDQEGGRVIRFRDPFTKFPPAYLIGKLINRDKNSVKISYEIGKIVGSELRISGLNMNLAPVLDLYTNTKNKVIGDRSFGMDPILVSQIGLSMVAGMQDQHVIACGKHFPGHGDTEDDSHNVLPILQHDIRRLLTTEIRPFAHCIKNGILSVMTAHVKYEKIDNKYPSSISEIIVGKLLRKALRFTGIVITDDLGMGAIRKHYSVEESALLSIKAGTDVIMVCNDLETQKRVYEALFNAVIKKKIDESRINESVSRILRIKNQFLLPFKADIKKAKEVVGNDSHKKFINFLETQMKGIV